MLQRRHVVKPGCHGFRSSMPACSSSALASRLGSQRYIYAAVVLACFGLLVVREDLGTLRQRVPISPELLEVKKLFERSRRIPTTGSAPRLSRCLHHRKPGARDQAGGAPKEGAADVNSNASFVGGVERNVSRDNDFSLRGNFIKRASSFSASLPAPRSPLGSIEPLS